jgi:DNA modification methylase
LVLRFIRLPEGISRVPRECFKAGHAERRRPRGGRDSAEAIHPRMKPREKCRRHLHYLATPQALTVLQAR